MKLTLSDDDECFDGSNDCDTHAQCTNIPGGFNCECRIGFSGDGETCIGEI